MHPNKILITISFFLFLHSARAQKGFYIGLNAGYGFSVGGSTGYNYTSNSSSSTTYTNNPNNYGQGFIPCVQLGYYFNQTIGLDLGIGYLFGSNHINSYNSYNNSSLSGFQLSYATSIKFSSLFLNPSLIFKVPTGILRPYLRTGLFFGVINQLTENESVNGSSNNYSLVESGGVTFGVNAALGLEIALDKNFSILGEVFFRYANYAPGSYTSTTTNYNSGSYNPSTITYYGNHVDNLTIKYSSTSSSATTSTSNNIAQDKPIVMYAANAIGVSIGVKYYFNPK